MFREALIWILFMNVSGCIKLFNTQIGVGYQRNTFAIFYFFLHVCCHGKMSDRPRHADEQRCKPVCREHRRGRCPPRHAADRV